MPYDITWLGSASERPTELARDRQLAYEAGGSQRAAFEQTHPLTAGGYDLNGNYYLPKGDADDPDATSGVYSDLGLVMTNTDYERHAASRELRDTDFDGS